MPWDKQKSIEHLRKNALPPYGRGKCATFVRLALEAGDLAISQSGSGSAKDMGTRLQQAGFQELLVKPLIYQVGDIAVIDGFYKSDGNGIKKDHPDGHVAMFDGSQWISDFRQSGRSPYPGSDYDRASPSFDIYRYP